MSEEVKTKVKDSLIIKLIIGVIIGFIVGIYSNEQVIGVINTIKFILGQVVLFVVPLIILGFITPAITQMKSNASKMLGTMLGLSYVSSVGAAFMSMVAGYALIPLLNIERNKEAAKALPDLIFKVEIPQVMSVMSALVLSIFIGLAVIWTNSKKIEELLVEFGDITLSIVNKIIIPILPFFIACTFATLAYEGNIIKQLPVFFKVIVIVLIGHFIWLFILYTIGGIVNKCNPLDVLKYYGPAYLTAVGTMSSAATLPVALKCARKSPVLDEDVVNFGVPLGSNTHLCGSVLTEVFFVMTVSKILYGQIPSLGTMLLFIVLLGVFAVGAPGVPGGTVMASIGIIYSVLAFKEDGVALMLTVFALQDSFGTACNVTGDGALTMILNGLFKKSKNN